MSNVGRGLSTDPRILALAEGAEERRRKPATTDDLERPLTHYRTGPNMTELTSTLKATVTRLLEIQQQRTDLEAEEKHLKTVVRQTLKVGEQGTVHGQPVISVSPNRRFSPDLAASNLTAELLTLCTVTKIDSATAKKNLPPAIYETLMADVGEPIVRIL